MKRFGWAIGALLAGCVGVAVCAAPARASEASDTFRDVPDGHWAQKAVAEVAIHYALMPTYPDGTFRGDRPFTRAQFAVSLRALLNELEVLSRASWRHARPERVTYADVPASSPDRHTILSLADDYGLFDGVHGLTPDRFGPDVVVTRDEMARVIDNLLHRGEARGTVEPDAPPPYANPYRDLGPDAADRDPVLEDDGRYHVMVGFPDGTFRGEQQLTRYEYAATAAQTFPLIRELVQRSLERQAEARAMASFTHRFQEATPWAFWLQIGPTFGAATPSVTAGVGSRYVAYPDPWFFRWENRLMLDPGNFVSTGAPAANLGERFGLLADEDLQGFWAMPLVGPVQIQPHVGVRLLADAAAVNGGSLVGAAAGPAAGLLGYWRPGYRWGFWADAGMAGMVVGQASPVLGSLEGGVSYQLQRNRSLDLGLSYVEVPSGLRAPTSSGKAGVLAGTLGLGIAF